MSPDFIQRKCLTLLSVRRNHASYLWELVPFQRARSSLKCGLRKLGNGNICLGSKIVKSFYIGELDFALGCSTKHKLVVLSQDVSNYGTNKRRYSVSPHAYDGPGQFLHFTAHSRFLTRKVERDVQGIAEAHPGAMWAPQTFLQPGIPIRWRVDIYGKSGAWSGVGYSAAVPTCHYGLCYGRSSLSSSSRHEVNVQNSPSKAHCEDVAQRGLGLLVSNQSIWNQSRPRPEGA